MKNGTDKYSTNIPSGKDSDWQDEPFTALPEPEQKPFSPWFWLQWSLLMLIGFYFVSIFVGGFGNMHEYGANIAKGKNNVFILSKNEIFFFISLIFCIPSAIFFTMFADKFITKEKLAVLKKWIEPGNVKKTLLILIGVTGLIILTIVIVVLQQSPISDDELVYEFQTRIFTHGKLWLDSKPGDDALFEDNIFLVNNGKILGQYPFGQSFILVVGYILGFSHLAPLLLAMLTILGAYLLGKELYGQKMGLLTALLFAVSPMFLFTSSTLLSHTSALFFLTWFAYLAIKTVREKSLLYPILCGLAFGAAFHIRGATTLLVAGPAAVVLAFLMLKKPKENLGKILCLGVTVSGAVALFLFLNWYVNGNITHTNYYAAWIGKTQFDSPFGFGKGAWRIIHTPEQGMINLINNFVKLNGWSFGWPIGFLFVIVWAIRKDRTLVDFLCLIPIVLTFTAYVFYFWPGISDTGPVLYFELLLPLALLTVRGISKAPQLLTKYMDLETAKRRLNIFVAASIILAFATFHFYNAKALAKIPEVVAVPYQDMDIPEGEKAVVFTDFYFQEVGQQSWVAGHKNTHPELGDDVLYVLNFGRRLNEEFMEKYYPDHKGYVFHYKKGKPEFIPLSQYEVYNYLKNYPDSR